ncbi:hypothetical protein QLQ12_46115 [Actinoplanes sp. NEAU-A12]|uniref:Uncharacterized protein n=1 Tax=Actinoplanes sandaracinus TaxID=3045177 RepID=A0ABT6X1R3_9ACTN|nr:hypothetical protein [Actinoplanes sandaracinus]MDI6105971.1 hypothetical protein [Actinoplanes sandaracinus]
MMPDSADELDFTEISETAMRISKTNRLSVTSHEHDGILHIKIQPHRKGDEEGERREVVLSTPGTGIFVLTFDGQWSTHLAAYDREEQIETVEEAIVIARTYLEGAGVSQAVRRLFLPDKKVMVLEVNGEKIVLNDES